MKHPHAASRTTFTFIPNANFFFFQKSFDICLLRCLSFAISGSFRQVSSFVSFLASLFSKFSFASSCALFLNGFVKCSRLYTTFTFFQCCLKFYVFQPFFLWTVGLHLRCYVSGFTTLLLSHPCVGQVRIFQVKMNTCTLSWQDECHFKKRNLWRKKGTAKIRVEQKEFQRNTVTKTSENRTLPRENNTTARVNGTGKLM